MRDGSEVYACEAGNLSRRGALLTGDLPRPSGDRVRVSIHAARGDLALHVPARVVYVRDEGDGSRTLGIEFVALSDQESEVLQRMVARVVEGKVPAALEALGPGAKPAEMRRALDKTPVPHRIALALRGMYQERAVLMHDSSPQVLEALARNPNLALQEARMLGRSHKIFPATLGLLASDPRWARDEELKIILATHPRVPLQLAEQIVVRLNDASLRKVLQRSGLPLEVKAQLMNPVMRRRLLGR